MSLEEFAGWEHHNRLATSQRVLDPCSDCTFVFAAEMRAEGCCDGVPGESRTGRRPADARLRAQWREASQRRRDKAKAA